MSPPLPLSAGALAELRALCVAAQRDPSLLHDASLGDLRALLLALGGTLPPAPPAQGAPAAAPRGDGGDEDLRDEECVAPDTATQEMGPPPGAGEPSEEAQAAAAKARDAAAEAAAAGNFEEAVAAYTTAVKAAPSAALYAKRAECFLRLKRPNAAVRDADAALALNPDLARAYRARGTARRLLGAWEAAAADLGTALNIDFDEASDALLKTVVLPRAAAVRKRRVIAENAEKLRRQHEAERPAREAAAAATAAAAAASSAGKVRHVGDSAAFRALLDEAAAAGKPVLVDFFATWCGPCKMIAPVVEEMARTTPGVIFAKVDVDACQDVSRAAGVSAMPTFQLFKNGAKVNELRGADAAALKRMVQGAL